MIKVPTPSFSAYINENDVQFYQFKQKFEFFIYQSSREAYVEIRGAKLFNMLPLQMKGEPNEGKQKPKHLQNHDKRLSFNMSAKI